MPKNWDDTLKGSKPERGEVVKVYDLMRQDTVDGKWTGKKFVDKNGVEIDGTWWRREI